MLIAAKFVKPTASQIKRHYKGTKQWKFSVGTKVRNLLKVKEEANHKINRCFPKKEILQ